MKRALIVVVVAALAGAAWWWSASEGSGDERKRLDYMGAEALRLHQLADHAASEKAYSLAADAALEAGDLEMYYKYRAQRGVCRKMLGRTEEARSDLMPALEWARENGELATEGLALGNLARVAELDGDIPLAVSRLSELVEVAEKGKDWRTMVLTLEQVANAQLRAGEADDALSRLDRALSVDPRLEPGERRRDALLREKAWALGQLGDDEGATWLWETTPRAPAGDARQALHLARLGLHETAAARALQAATGFGDAQPAQRDEAFALHVGELLRAGRLDEAADRLDTLLGAGSSPVAEAPFRVLEGRLAWLRGDLPRAASLFAEAAEVLLAEGAATRNSVALEALWLRALALDDMGENARALEVAESLSDDLASTLVRGWLLREWAGPERLVTSELPGLFVRDDAEAREALRRDASLERLRAVSPRPLPTMAWLSLHLHLADGDRLLGRGRDDLREDFVKRGLRSAVTWRMRELAYALDGRWPDADRLAPHAATLERWLAGDLPDDEAVTVVFTGPSLSYLALFTTEWPGTCFGLPPAADLSKRVIEINEAVRNGSILDVAEEGHRLHRLLFGARAKQDMQGKRLLSLMLPLDLSGLPPALLVTDDPLPGTMPAWMVRERDLRLLAFPPAAPRVPATDTVLRAGEAAVDVDASQLVLPRLRAEFGDGLLAPGGLLERESGSPRFLRGDAFTASALRVAGDALRWELAAAGAGLGRLGGLLLAPDPAAERVDEQRGVLTWSRLGRLDLPPQLVLDRTRFDPADGGPLLAATAATLGGADALLLTRWPLPMPLREGFLGHDPGLFLSPTLMSGVLRGYLERARVEAPLEAQHPRAWGAWMLYGGVDPEPRDDAPGAAHPSAPDDDGEPDDDR